MNIISEQEAVLARETLEKHLARLAELDAHPLGDPADQSATRARTENLLKTIQRDIAMWEAGIREPVPGNPDLVESPWTSEQINAMSDEEYERTSAAAGVLLKRAEIAQIDRAIGEALDRIADWRRHRAWLEREIAELEQGARTPQHSAAS